ncbi:LEAF RUST 10 DISEASE-RESISTANCE LOCUS RECEPTOR-LIKE PROTEIN KINASE-like 1.1 isoform X2 [Salvia miltiorrhiza]|uniref:LEAF RUST 10 DISEASE-RESISTANCE LOCUS RECEPTOR-LIKE PROTEIN KINASE-like 1.1 isoform X2 n=1 Tax=Salvia miltiorrhiza TaxID=226208 RepID=UPI0025ACF657|nr:LEAF RUST 10 DISEASE-RESISTANCE LOCUS RECEPTOR-LIKE PROTEIN KINASE-like 1.1 isoform X2 [Salvia miltiorrhiza]
MMPIFNRINQAREREVRERMGVGKDVLLLVLWHLLLLQADSKCQKSYTCRNFTLQFPFTYIDDPQCGLFTVAGCESSSREKHPRLYIGASTSAKYILGQPSQNKLLIHDFLLETLLGSPESCYSFLNVSLPQSPSVSFTISPNITFFTCFNKTTNRQIQDYFQNYSRQDCEASTLYYKTPATQEHAPQIPEACSLAQLPIKSDENSTQLLKLLSANYSLEWNVSEDCNECYRRGGQCLADNQNDFYCKSKTAENRLTVILLASLIPGVAILVLLGGCIFWLRKKKMGGAYLLSRNLSYDPSSKSDIEDGSFNFGVPIFSYTELVDATGNFDPSKELGDGGFGTVYYGKLRDGREVAIKRLYEHNYRRVEQFLNEIKILTSLRHPNLVSLYGCTSRRSRELLLVYEYIPNGTVADHLHGERASEAPLTWGVRMSIARETATALAYLHKSDIIHRDVKTNNILLDSNFSVKVADFGLSRLFPIDVTHISTAPQGTPGYVDPEYHQCYQLTDKSDVYSFGVVLIELISSMPAVDISRHKHEINLASLAVNKIQRCAFDELIDPFTGYNSDAEATRMTTSVAELAFRCLQLDKDMRPSMEEVVAFLHDIHTGGDCDFDQVKGGARDLQGKIPPSPETDEVVLLKSRIYQSSPTAVTDTWISSDSTTASSVG